MNLTPEQQKELWDFMQALKSSTTIPYEVDGAFRARLLGTLTVSRLGLPVNLVNAPRSAISAPSGGAIQDTQARTTINDIITALEELGLVTAN